MNDWDERRDSQEGAQTPGAGGDGPYLPIPLAAAQPGTFAPADLYIRTGEPAHYTLYKAAHTRLEEKVRNRLAARGVDRLYLAVEDEAAFLDYVEQHMDAIIRDALLPVEEACRFAYAGSRRVMERYFDHPHSAECLERARQMVESAILGVMRVPGALWQMTALTSDTYATCTHCVNVALFLVAASEELLGYSSGDDLEQIGLAGILHDLGKSLIPEEILLKPGGLNDEEFEQIKKHPAWSVELISRHWNPPELCRDVIRHHHENCDGTGYPDALPGEELGSVARLSRIVDVYDALTTNRPYGAARTPYKALELMLNEEKAHLDLALLRGFVGFLGPREARA